MELQATTVFERNYDALYNPRYRHVPNQGGSRSSKTVSLCQLFIIDAIKQKQAGFTSIVRKGMPALKATVMRDFFETLIGMNLYDKKRHNKTEHTYTFPNGYVIEFFSVDDEQKVRGRKRRICWCNEANELFEDDYLQLNLRTTYKMFYDFNPSDSSSWLYDLDPEETCLIKSTYKDNPFLEAAIIRQIENLIRTDESLYSIYALGERSQSKSHIYTTWTETFSVPERFTKFVYGLDFGYNHPTALVKVWYHEDEVILQEVVYESYLTTPELVERFKQNNVEQNVEILADYSRPEIIKELQIAGFNVLNANKEVKNGINALKTKKVSYIGKHIKKEVENYKWKKKGDMILDEPVKLYDDAMDAARYGHHFIHKNFGAENTYDAF